ncbi:MAG: glycoside hydrolase family 18 protein [Chitinophagaceae bacterium]|nr:glycoside hydrolase family 18 protein [Chitinophagaceae bacterium]
MSRTVQKLISLLWVSLIVSGCKKNDVTPPTPPVVISPPPDLGFKVVGYFPYYRDPATVPDVKFRMTNVVNYAFGIVTPSGSLSINSIPVFTAIIAKAKANNAKIFLSLSGSHTDFKNMAATDAGRRSFIKEVMNAVRSYQLHGVDMDWEFPRTDDGTDATYTALMKELSDSCHRDAKYYITAAVTAGKYAGVIRDAIKNELFNYVDWFNVMSYDDFSTTTPYRHHSDYTLAQVSVNYWTTTRGMPKTKFVLGIPAYGRPSGITQTNTVLSYAAILAQSGSSQSDSAIVTAGGHPSPYMIYYNGQPTVKKKAMLAKTAGNGIMMWEKWHDTHDAASLLKAACDTIGRTY